MSSLQVQRLTDLSRRFRPILIRFFQKRIRPEWEVEDLVQEVFVRLARRGDLADVVQVEGYIFQVAANLIRERARELEKQKISFEQVETENIQEDFSPERILIGRESVAEVYAALHELPQRTRMAFILHRFEDLIHAEIAIRLGVSVSTVEKEIMRAMAYLVRRVR